MNFYSDVIPGKEAQWVLDDDQVHHFKNVQRGKAGATVKVFDGKGSIAVGEVIEIKKKSIVLSIQSVSKQERPVGGLTLILGTPKKEYVESIFRSATQVGISEIFLIETKYSPYRFMMSDRFQKILRSSMTQSENPWMPLISSLSSLESIKTVSEEILVFTTERGKDPLRLDKAPSAYFIGPEGGFHNEELDFLESLKNIHFTRCDTPIMKAEVAVPYCASFVRSLAATLSCV